MLIPYISFNYFLIGCISDCPYVLTIAPEFSTPQFYFLHLRKFFEYSFRYYRLNHVQHLTRAMLWLSTAEDMYMILIKSNFIDYNIVPFTNSLHCLSDIFLHFLIQQNLTILYCSHKMVSDFVDRMRPLSQFHYNCIIIPQTPFTKGGSRFPRRRDSGVYNFNQYSVRQARKGNGAWTCPCPVRKIEEMVQVNGIVKAYGRHVLFDGASFTLGAGERAGLVGRNGSGKTTLFRLILGEEQPDSGSISVPRDYRAGHLLQHMRFAAGAVLDEAALGLRGDGPVESRTYRAQAVLMGLGFRREDFSRHPSELSGGFQVRLNLVKLLLEEPNLLLLDEPTNYLDIVSSRWLGRFLKSWKGELILITHDRDFMDSVTTHTIGIHRARTRKIAGGTHKLHEQILAEEEVCERTRSNDEKRRRELEEFINRFRAQATRARAVQSKIKMVQKKGRMEKLPEEKKLDFEFNYAPHESKWLLRAEGISFGYRPGSPLFSSLDLSVARNDRIAVIGRNGQGKTTLLKILAGELKPDGGDINYSAKTALAHFGQTNVTRLDPARTIEEEILGSLPEHNGRAARNVCGAMLFGGDDALKKISVLSGGEKSRVLLGKIICQPANLLLLDEPTNHLDMASVDALIEAIEAFEGAAVIVTHSEMILRCLATRLVVFDGGRVSVFEGTYEDFLERKGWADEYPAPAGATAKNAVRAVNRKDLRRARAEIIAMRSRVLGGLQSKISLAEEGIIAFERQVEDDSRALIEASMKGNGQEIKRLSKSIHDAKEKIEALFEELAEAARELKARQGEFETRFAELGE